MAYTLGPVKPHVKAAAEEIGSRFDVPRISGFGTRSNSYSDHPLGLALDFSATGPDGDAIAHYVVANWERLGVKYVIWEQREKHSPGGEWKLMENRGSVSANHFDHVHVSFNATPGAGGAVVDQAGFANPLDGITSLIDSLKNISAAFAWASDSQNWIRVGQVALGATLLLIAVISWDRVKSTAATAAKAAVTKGVKSVR
jgi:hypothetical protein